MVKAIIFDMDGLLIDSEPLWREAEIKAFGDFGLKLNRNMCLETTGLRVDEVIDYWQVKFPEKKLPKKKLIKLIMKNVFDLVDDKGKSMPGVEQIFDFLEMKDIKIAVASSSSKALIKKVLKKLGLSKKVDLTHSAEDEEYGKPHPSVYISTAKKLGINPLECIAFEDSINGIVSAKSARIRCIAVPDKSLMGDRRLSLADDILASLSDFNEMTWRRMN